MRKILLLLSRWFRHLAAKRRALVDDKRLRILETVSLGEKRFVAVVRAEGANYLVGGAATNVTLLACLGAEASDVQHAELAKKPALLIDAPKAAQSLPQATRPEKPRRTKPSPAKPSTAKPKPKAATNQTAKASKTASNPAPAKKPLAARKPLATAKPAIVRKSAAGKPAAAAATTRKAPTTRKAATPRKAAPRQAAATRKPAVKRVTKPAVKPETQSPSSPAAIKVEEPNEAFAALLQRRIAEFQERVN